MPSLMRLGIAFDCHEWVNIRSLKTAAVNPVLEGTSGNDLAAKHLAVGNLINLWVGVLVCLALLAPTGQLLVTISAAADVEIVKHRMAGTGWFMLCM